MRELRRTMVEKKKDNKATGVIVHQPDGLRQLLAGKLPARGKGCGARKQLCQTVLQRKTNFQIKG